MKDDAYQPAAFGFIAESVEDGAVDAPGGSVQVYTAGGTLLVGDVVFVSAANTVNKSNTPANYQGFAGVVVGGTKTDMRVITRRNDYGITAAVVNEKVLVQNSGKAIVIADAATAVAANLTQGATTAGRVDDSASATQGQIIGQSLEAAANAGDKLLALISHR
jgi:hypothetical protein